MMGRRLALRSRAMLAFGLLALLVSSGVAAASYELTRSTLIRERERGAERQTYLNARSVRGAIAADASDLRDALSRVQTSSGGLALLRVGEEWFSSSVPGGRNDVPPSLMEAVDAGFAGRQRISTPDGPAVAVGVPIAGTEAVYVELIPLREVDNTLDRVARGLLIAVLVATVIGLFAGRWLSARVLRPVRRTAEAANQIREGAIDRRLESEEDADLQPLVDSFNQMVDGLQDRIEREARFASDVSHELRSPLATMDAALSVARRRVADPAANDALDVLEREVARFRDLIIDLLEIARAEAGVLELAYEEVDLSAFAAGVLEATHRDTVELEVEPGAGRYAVFDKRRIGQAIVNLLDNADNYGGGATRLTLSGGPDTVRFVVDDEGPGVAEHERQYVFQRFARGADAVAQGTGLGLALVAEHVRLHGGTVTVDDAPGGGARFVIEIARGTATAGATTRAGEAT